VIDHLHAAWTELTSPGAPFALTDSVIRNVPVRVFAAAPTNMRTVWEMAAARGETTYIVYEDERLSYGEVAAQVRSLAAALRNDHGINSGDRVAIAMRNYPEWIVAYWATLAVGAAVVGMNAWWTTPEMEYGLTDSRPKVLIADDERLSRAEPILEQVRSSQRLGVIAVRTDRALPNDSQHWTDVVNIERAPTILPDVSIDPDDDACIFYTSGTTGFPKGAQLTHQGCVTNLMHIGFWGNVVPLALAKASQTPANPVTAVNPVVPATPPRQGCFMAPTPLFHVTANNCILHPATLTGAKIVLTYKWDPRRALELIEREQVTNFSGVPTMSRELLLHPDWATRDTSSLVGMGGGGAAVQPDLVSKIDSALTKSGTPSTGYGLTETHGIVTANGNIFFTSKPASCGPVMPTFDAKLIDDNGDDVPRGGRGQLCVRGPGVIKGYLNRPEATADSIRDGWFNTGDIAEIDDDGFVYIVDRAKDMVLRGGENVYCSEVEMAIYAHDAVQEVAVFGIPDERLGEAVACGILLKPGATCSEADLRAFLAASVAKHKIPSKVWFLDAPIPRNASGKLVRRQLRDELLATLAG
jgi:long-chain acyl-CoA synthetase